MSVFTKALRPTRPSLLFRHRITPSYYYFKSTTAVSASPSQTLKTSAAPDPVARVVAELTKQLSPSESGPPALARPPPHTDIDDKPPAPPSDGYPIQAMQKDQLNRPTYHLHVNSTPNNTILTFTNPKGEVRAWSSGGRCKFKGVHRSGYEAGYQVSLTVFKMIEEISKNQGLSIQLIFKGFGVGREAFLSALKTKEGDRIREMVVSLQDRTPIKIGGTRAKKARRL